MIQNMIIPSSRQVAAQLTTSEDAVDQMVTTGHRLVMKQVGIAQLKARHPLRRLHEVRLPAPLEKSVGSLEALLDERADR
jgi:hypothetical protein